MPLPLYLSSVLAAQQGKKADVISFLCEAMKQSNETMCQCGAYVTLLYEHFP